ncbi:branched-chain amino acid ABC transporter permease [Candidatus Woesearchaeota archaeon CG10_big_fil_rev_8_21_14_0_10_34_8]|nr:MAG: branched-chain amino acid ABC transporter permease [Candidatus Woesearchaeota archaeon CG10_big_fil_rev_8_21_14_0_10_34_8]
MIFSQLIVNSIIIGSIYALVASGFSLIYATNKYMHFAHGVAIALAAYIVYFLSLHISFPIACILTILLSGCFGVAMHRCIYLPLQKRGASTVILLIASIAMLIFFENLIQLIFGADVKTIRILEVTRGIDFFGAVVTPLQFIIVLVSLIIFAALFMFMKFTVLGRNMRAVADNKELASIVGINHARVADYSFFIGSCLAGVAGILIGMEQNLTPLMGTMLIIRGFTGAVVGAVEVVAGAIVGSYILGFAENFGVWYLPSGYKDAIAFILLFIFLLFKPHGIFGIEKGVKK